MEYGTSGLEILEGKMEDDYILCAVWKNAKLPQQVCETSSPTICLLAIILYDIKYYQKNACFLPAQGHNVQHKTIYIMPSVYSSEKVIEYRI